MSTEAMTSTTQLRHVRDRIDVAEVLSRYSYGWDTRDFELVRSCFTPDAAVEYSSLPDFASGFPEFFELERATILQLAATQHLISNLLVRVDGDTATCSSYVQATHYDDAGHTWTTGGRYDDELVRAADGWRISRRRFTRQWIHDPDGLSQRFLAN